MRWPALTLTLMACATPGPAPSAVSAPAAETSEVASAFEPEPEPTAAPPARRATPPPPLTDLRGPFKEALAASARALTQRDLEAARSDADRAATAAKALGAAERARAAEQSGKVALAAGDASLAHRAAREWRASCGAENPDTCREGAHRLLLSAARLPSPLAKALNDEAAALQTAQACLKGCERARKAERCLAASETAARAHQDPGLVAQAALVHALAAPEAKQAALLAAVAQGCDAAACVPPRRRALGHLAAKARAEKKPEEVARLAIKDVQLAGALLPESERVWARTAELDAACAALDASAAPGACRKLEKQLTGGWTFRDFSTGAPQEGLSGDQVRTVNEHYAPLLQECLGAQARRLTPPDAVRYELRWMVFNDGRVGEVHFKNPAADASELGRCLRAQFETWRYPRYEGEWQHVEQAFTVTAVQRR